jgi:hypothetical protein
MNFRGLIIALVVLAGLSGVLYWSQHRKPAEDSPATPANTTPVILKINAADVIQITLKQKQSGPVTLHKSETGQWQITEPAPYQADQETVAGILSTLSALSPDRVVEEKASDRKQYGLDLPTVEADITGKGRVMQQLILGDDTPLGGDVYAALAGDNRVFTISSFNKTSLNKSLDDLRDKSLMTIDPDKVSRVELLKKPQEIEFGRTKDGWQILKPESWPADSSAVNGLVRSLTSAKMELSGSGAANAAAEFSRATPIATAKLTGDNGVQTLELRKSKNDYYAKSSVVDGAFKVSSTLGSVLDKKADDFRQKK